MGPGQANRATKERRRELAQQKREKINLLYFCSLSLPPFLSPSPRLMLARRLFGWRRRRRLTTTVRQTRATTDGTVSSAEAVARTTLTLTHKGRPARREHTRQIRPQPDQTRRAWPPLFPLLATHHLTSSNVRPERRWGPQPEPRSPKARNGALSPTARQPAAKVGAQARARAIARGAVWHASRLRSLATCNQPDERGPPPGGGLPRPPPTPFPRRRQLARERPAGSSSEPVDSID